MYVAGHTTPWVGGHLSNCSSVVLSHDVTPYLNKRNYIYVDYSLVLMQQTLICAVFTGIFILSSYGYLVVQQKTIRDSKKHHTFELMNSVEDDDVPQFVVTSSEFGSSLMSLLNLAEELGARSANSKFRKSTDRLRNLFAKTFIQRYSLAKDQIKPIADALSSIDRLGAYDSDMESLSFSILKQIEDVEGIASSIVFYNEPLPKLEELSFPFKYPHNAFDSIPSTLSKTDFDGGYNISIPDIQASLSAFERNFNVIKDGIVSSSKLYDNEKLLSEMNKLKTGLRLENLIWRKEAAKAMMSTATTGISSLTNQAADSLFSLSSQAKDGISALGSQARDTLNRDVLSSLSNEAARNATNFASRFWRQARRAVRRSASYFYPEPMPSTLPLPPLPLDIWGEQRRRVVRHMSEATYSRWRDSISLLERPVGSRVRGLEGKKEAAKEPARTDSYPLLLHSCLLMSMATYNLRLSLTNTPSAAAAVAVAEIPWSDLSINLNLGARGLLGNSTQRSMAAGYVEQKTAGVLAAVFNRIAPTVLRGVIASVGKGSGTSPNSPNVNTNANASSATSLSELSNYRAKVMTLTALGLGYDEDLLSDEDTFRESAIVNTGGGALTSTVPPPATRGASKVSNATRGATSSTTPPSNRNVITSWTRTSAGVRVCTMSSSKACAIFTYDGDNDLASVSFRGTKDPVDVITDITFLSSELTPMVPLAQSAVGISSKPTGTYRCTSLLRLILNCLFFVVFVP